jgi:molecular chaperone GrpE
MSRVSLGSGCRRARAAVFGMGGGSVVTDDTDVMEEPDPVLIAVTEMRESIANLAHQVAREHERSQARERVIDWLHEEAGELKKGQAREALRPVVSDLRRLRDDLITQARSVPETMERDEVAALLESYADSVVLALERCGVVVVHPSPEAPFDARQQQVTGIAETTAQRLDGLIASVVSDGYAEAGTGHRIASARVVVYRYTEDAYTEDANQASDQG